MSSVSSSLYYCFCSLVDPPPPLRWPPVPILIISVSFFVSFLIVTLKVQPSLHSPFIFPFFFLHPFSPPSKPLPVLSLLPLRSLSLCSYGTPFLLLLLPPRSLPGFCICVVFVLLRVDGDGASLAEEKLTCVLFTHLASSAYWDSFCSRVVFTFILFVCVILKVVKIRRP